MMACGQTSRAVVLLLLSWVLAGAAPKKRAALPDAQQIRSALSPAPEPGYLMHAVRVGTTPDARRATFIRDPSMPARIQIAFAFWVLQGLGRVVLVDAGFVDPRMAKLWRVRGYRDPQVGLAELGLKPEQVTDLVITHHHWDHVGGLQRFKGATIWITSQALKAALAWAQKNDPALLGALGAAERGGRIRLTESLQSVAPHVVVVPVGLHARGFQYVVVHNHDGIWVLASDLAPLRANLERRRSTGLTSHAKSTLAVMDTMLALVEGDLSRIVTGHHPGGFDAKGIIQLSLQSGGQKPQKD